MRYLSLALPLIIAACGSTMTQDDFTAESISITCDQVFECYTEEELALFGGMFGESASECVVLMEALMAEAETDPKAETVECDFNAEAAQTCLDEGAAMSCDDVKTGTSPAACADVCTAAE